MLVSSYMKEGPQYCQHLWRYQVPPSHFLIQKILKVPHQITYSHPINNHESHSYRRYIPFPGTFVVFVDWCFARPHRVKESVCDERVKGHYVASIVNSRGLNSLYISQIIVSLVNLCLIGKLTLLTVMKNMGSKV